MSGPDKLSRRFADVVLAAVVADHAAWKLGSGGQVGGRYPNIGLPERRFGAAAPTIDGENSPSHSAANAPRYPPEIGPADFASVARRGFLDSNNVPTTICSLRLVRTEPL